MKIMRGPMLDEFAMVFEIDLCEVVEWVNSYVNRPEEFPQAEATEKERFESIKRYITWRLGNSSNARIRMENKKRRFVAEICQGGAL